MHIGSSCHCHRVLRHWLFALSTLGCSPQSAVNGSVMVTESDAYFHYMARRLRLNHTTTPSPTEFTLFSVQPAL